MGVDIWMHAEVLREGAWTVDAGFGEFVCRDVALLEALMNGPIDWQDGLPSDRAAHLDEDGDDPFALLDEDENAPMWCSLAGLEVVDWAAVAHPEWSAQLERLRASVPAPVPRRFARLRPPADPRRAVRVLAYWA